MKDKMKKIMAGVGMGLTLAGSGMLMTGCTMTAEQQAALDNVVGKTDQIVELLDKQSKQLSQSEALRLYEYAKTRLLVNKDNVWDNLKTSFSQDTSEEGYYDTVEGYSHFFKFANGKRVLYSANSVDGEEGLISGYFDEVVEKEESNGGDGYQTLTEIKTYTYLASNYATTIINMIDISEEDIVDCEILENGNYKITASLIVCENQGSNNAIEYPCLITIELAENGYLISYNCLTLMEDDFNNSIAGDKYVLSTNVKYEYGALTEAEVQAKIDKYKAQQANN